MGIFSRQEEILPALSSFVADSRDRRRQSSFPLASSSRKKDRRWPLVLRFWKGSIHATIFFPVLAHAVLAAFVVFVNQHINRDFNLPSSIIPSLSIVVGLMLVFRNQTAYSRFWNGRCHLATITTAVRCISRQILSLVPPPNPPAAYRVAASQDSFSRTTALQASVTTLIPDSSEPTLSKLDEVRIVETVKILIAMLYTIKNHLRAEWGLKLSPGTSFTEDGQSLTTEDYQELLPQGLKGYEHRGLGLTLELGTFVEKFISRGARKEWFHNAACASMVTQLDSLTKAYGDMEVIRLVPVPVAHLIHHKQTLALFCGILPFAMAANMGWWTVPLTAFVCFTLYGIEGIAISFEDPFGVDKIDINMDEAVEDTRREVEVLLAAWQCQGQSGGLFRHCLGDGRRTPANHTRRNTGNNNGNVHFANEMSTSSAATAQTDVLIVVNAAGKENRKEISRESSRENKKENWKAGGKSIGKARERLDGERQPLLD